MKRLTLSVAISAILAALFYAPVASAQSADILMLPPTLYGSSTACDDTVTNLQILTFNAYSLNPSAPALGSGVSSINCFSGMNVDPATGNIFTSGTSASSGAPLNVGNISRSATTVLSLNSSNNRGAYVLFSDKFSSAHPPMVGTDGDDFAVQVAAVPPSSTSTGWQGAIIAKPGGDVGLGTTSPIGNLDIENGTTTATLCLNGNCVTNLPPNGCHLVKNQGGPPNYSSDARCAANEYVMTGGGVANQPPSWTICPSTALPADALRPGFIHTSIPDTDLQGWSVDGYAGDESGDVCTEAYAVCCPYK